jgi:hypothetical protein
MTSLRTIMRFFAVAILSGGAVLAPTTAGAQAAASCTDGDLQTLFQAFPIHAAVVTNKNGHPRMVESVSRCSYRVFFDGETVTLSASGKFLGGIVWLDDYPAQGISRSAAIADLASISDRVWLAPVLPDGSTGVMVEKTLMTTAYKDVNHPSFGKCVYQHRAFITQLTPGEYVSYWESVSPAETLTATVHLVITP